MSKSYLFILNPHSGTSLGSNAGEMKDAIAVFAKKHGSEAKIVFTEERAHATELVRENLPRENWAAIVAVGGDGTINEIAQPLVGATTPIGIIPMGSGNGLARHLGIPLRLDAALDRLFLGKTTIIDSASINGIPFFCTAGVGFDAYVGHLFSQQKQRGLKTYIDVSFRSFWTYKPQYFEVDGVKLSAFSVSFANAGQFGNNAWVAPHANLQDGTLDVCIIHPFPKWYGTSLAYQLFTKQMRASRFVDYKSAQSVEVKTDRAALIHYDGEPLQLDTNIVKVVINPASLNVIV